jgi:hypothetical protein
MQEHLQSVSTVLIVSYHFHPASEIGARRVTALAQYLAQRGIRVVVVSAFGNQPVERGAELLPGVIAIPVKRPARRWLDLLVALKRWRRGRTQRSAKPDTVQRPSQPPSGADAGTLGARSRDLYFRFVHFIDEYKRWARLAQRAAVHAGREYDARLILASAPPHSALLSGAWAARRLGIPYVADLRDPLSDTVAESHPHRHAELRMLRVLERWIMQSAAAVTSTAATAAALLADRNPDMAGKLHVIRNGYDGAVTPPLTDTGGRLSLLFAGVLYIRRTPYPLLAALEEFLARPDIDPARIRLTLMGGKVGRFSDQALKRWLRGKRCEAVVRILPAQSAQAVADEVERATVLLNLAQQQHLHVPAKTYEYLAAGREVLLLCEDDCETAGLVAGIRGVIQVDQSDARLLGSVLLDLYNRHVIGGALTAPAEADIHGFSRECANERFLALLACVASAGRPPERTPLITLQSER